MRQDLEANYTHKYSTLILAAAHFQTLIFLYPDKTSLTRASLALGPSVRAQYSPAPAFDFWGMREIQLTAT